MPGWRRNPPVGFMLPVKMRLFATMAKKISWLMLRRLSAAGF
jgi:hypothetical protein